MPLSFEGDAIALSGEYGTRLKTRIISRYYDFWFGVTARHGYVPKVYIVEMDAGTGKLYFKDTKTTELGSAGHSLELRYGPTKRYSAKLNIVLVEENSKCRKHMDNVIRRRWPKASLTQRSGGGVLSADGCVTRYNHVSEFLKATSYGYELGISLFYFDPLLSVDWSLLDGIAKARITKPYRTGTEFQIFFFTSDWLTGRNSPFFHPLPRFTDEDGWSAEETTSAGIADRTFGSRKWLSAMVSGKTKAEIESKLVELYKRKLRKWFRFVLPLPFVPKKDQVYHVFCCSNFDVGISVISRFYEDCAGIPFGLMADNVLTYHEFKSSYPSIVAGYTGRRRPPEWKVLWHVMRNHVDGLCDLHCKDLRGKAGSVMKLKSALEWLETEGYLRKVKIPEWPWSAMKFPVYKINWKTTETKLNVKPPVPPQPLKPP